MPELKTLLEDVTFDFEQSEDSLGPHIALTFDFQGGAASGYNKPLLFKSDNIEINKELVTKLKELGEDTTQIEKAMYANDLRNMLSQAIRDKHFVDKYEYVWVMDWNESVAIFCTDAGTFSVDYTNTDSTVQVSDVANPVVPIQDYVVVDGDILVSDDLMDSLEDNLYQMLSKSFKSPATKEVIKASIKKFSSSNNVPDVIKSEENNNSVINSEDKSKPEGKSSVNITKEKGASIVEIADLLKSAEAQDLIKAAVAQATKEKEDEKEELAKSLKAANERLEAVEKAEQKRVKAAYEDVVKGFGFVEEGEVENVVKALMADTENSVIFIEMLNKAHEQIEKVKAEFASEKGSDRKAETPKEGVEKVKAIAAILKAKQETK